MSALRRSGDDGGDTIVHLDRKLGLLERLVEVGKRQQRHRVRRLEIERELQIDQRQIFAAAAADRSAKPVKRFGGAGLRRIGERRQFVAGGDFLHLLRRSPDDRATALLNS